MMVVKMMTLAASLASIPVTAPGPLAPLAGTMIEAGKSAPVLLIVPGSGPTDRDGNNPLGVKAAPYRMLAEALAAKGISSVRIDKRGLGGSAAAVQNGNDVTISDYAIDVHNWVDSIQDRTHGGCVWVLGHSEGGLIALAAAQQPMGICGLILVSAPGRKLSDVIREQLRSNPANAPLLPSALSALDSLEKGEKVDATKLDPALQRLFAPQVQGFLINMFQQDPAKLAAATKLPMLIVRGDKDIQVAAADLKALHTARPDATILSPPNMNHVLKDVAGDDRASNLAVYADPALPIDSSLVEGIAAFVKTRR
jgi:pimeloyl-ACP methyl ester carboxylesterase